VRSAFWRSQAESARLDYPIKSGSCLALASAAIGKILADICKAAGRMCSDMSGSEEDCTPDGSTFAIAASFEVAALIPGQFFVSSSAGILSASAGACAALAERRCSSCAV
jgi:hypothetical protein